MNHIKAPIPACFAAAEESIARVARKLNTTSAARDDVVLMRLVTSLARRYDELVSEAIRPEKLNQVMFKTLIMAFGSPDNELNPSELSSATGESRANMTRICDQLCERGLIERHAAESDRRRIVVSLTPAGEKVVRKLLPHMRESLQQAHVAFNAKDRRELERLLKVQLSGLEAVRHRGERG
jgi:MarR family transcriptional regulator, negative regulator of the multidrug operon emrRAB